MKQLILALAVISSTASANVIHPIPSAPVTPSNLKVGDQYYDLSMDGIEKYMTSMASSNPEAYKSLHPSFDSLRQRQNIAWAAGGALVASGAAIAVGAFTFLQHEDLEYDNTTTKQPNMNAFLIGTTTAIAGVGAYLWIKPGRTQFLEFINQHNQRQDVSPIKLNLGFRGDFQHPRLALQLTF